MHGSMVTYLRGARGGVGAASGAGCTRERCVMGVGVGRRRAPGAPRPALGGAHAQVRAAQVRQVAAARQEGLDGHHLRVARRLRRERAWGGEAVRRAAIAEGRWVPCERARCSHPDSRCSRRWCGSGRAPARCPRTGRQTRSRWASRARPARRRPAEGRRGMRRRAVRSSAAPSLSTSPSALRPLAHGTSLRGPPRTSCRAWPISSWSRAVMSACSRRGKRSEARGGGSTRRSARIARPARRQAGGWRKARTRHPLQSHSGRVICGLRERRAPARDPSRGAARGGPAAPRSPNRPRPPTPTPTPTPLPGAQRRVACAVLPPRA